MPIVEMPDGAQVQFPDEMPKEQIREMIASKFPEVSQSRKAHLGHKIGAAIDGVAQGMTFGFSDEIAAGLDSGFGFLGDYDKSLEDERTRMEENKKLAGGYELAGNLAGGLTTAGGLMKSGVSLLPKIKNPLAGAVAEGSVYGSLYGAGTSKEDERLKDGLIGGVVGGVTGGTLQKAGDSVGKMVRGKAQQIAPTLDELAVKTKAMYDKMRNSGAVIKSSSSNKLKKNLLFVAGKPNETLRPKTAGMLKEVKQALSGNLDFEDLHELSRTFNRVKSKGIDPEDAEFVGRMKKVLDNYVENIKPGEMVSGKTEAVKMLREADKLYARQKKTQIVENLMDLADVQTGQYTQSGMANTIVREMRKLYKNKKMLAGFSKEEVALVRQMAKGGSASQTINLLAKFAPRGVVSSILGIAGPTSTIGPAGLALPLAGHFAAKQADKAAVKAAETLRNNVASGFVPKQLPNPLQKIINPLIPTASGQVVQQY